MANTFRYTKPTTRYRDLDLDFGRNLMSDDVNAKTDDNAVKRSIRNLILLNHYEKPFHPEIGSGIRSILFENISRTNAFIMEKMIADLIDTYEPRAALTGVSVVSDADHNSYDVTIRYRIVGVNEPKEVNVILKVLR